MADQGGDENKNGHDSDDRDDYDVAEDDDNNTVRACYYIEDNAPGSPRLTLDGS